MHIRYRTEAIFLKKQKRFEADEYLIAYSKKFGKIGVTGKSIRKIKSKLRSSSELFCYSDIEFVRGKYYNILTDSELVSSFSNIKSQLGKMAIAFKMANLLDSFLTEEEKDDNLWFFVKKSFYLLDEIKEAKKRDLESFYFYFSFKFLEILGYKPEISKCVIDGNKKVESFSPRSGGLICEVCNKKNQDPFKVKITDKDRVFLKRVSKKKFEEFMDNCPEFDNLDELLDNYLALLPSRMS